MNKTVAIMQPGYLPWIGFFDLLMKSDVFVVYDNVQYDKGGWRNRNRIKTKTGPAWLTVPVSLPKGLRTKIKEVRINNKTKWRQQHLKTLKQNYRNTPFFKLYFNKIREALDSVNDSLLESNVMLIKLLAECIGIEHFMVLSSETGIKDSDRIARLIKLLKNYNADIFYEPAGGKRYIGSKEIERFNKNGISVKFQEIMPQVYKQEYQPFIPNLSIVDLLFNEGPNSLEIIKNCTRKGDLKK